VSPYAVVADAPELRASGSYPDDDAAIKGWIQLGLITVNPTWASRRSRILFTLIAAVRTSAAQL
jgi:hypothetical protein